ncbi:hypothetical protein E4U41_000488 [Claviceps citrina]|nr:hypothetical protein E4U41_000488 [Claviceps citrina]
MTSPKLKDPLDALQSLVNDVLVQTGKALRASRRDSHGNVPPTHMQAKLPDTISAFHSALDSLEHDIIRAKSVILRDINLLKTQKDAAPAEDTQSLPQPHPVEAQSKAAMVIDIDSSPPAFSQASSKQEAADNTFTGMKTAAPFPDMGMPAAAGTSIAIKEEPQSSQSISMTEARGSSKVKAEVKQSIQAAPIPIMDAKSDSKSSGLNGGREVLDLTSSDLNFTDMEFTLAPSIINANQSGGNAAAAANTNGSSLDPGWTRNGPTAATSVKTHMPSTTVEKAAATASVNGPAESRRNAEAQKKEGGATTTLTDVYAGNGQADGMDFDFGIGDGMSGDTFDDLMNDRDNSFDPMEHGDYDANYFGLDKADGT